MIAEGICVQFKSDLLRGLHEAEVDDYKLALYDPSVSLDYRTKTDYTPGETGEVVGTGYTAGGETVGSATITNYGESTVAMNFMRDATWTEVSVTFRSGLIYNSNKTNTFGGRPVVAVLDFGDDQSPSAEELVVKINSISGKNFYEID